MSFNQVAGIHFKAPLGTFDGCSVEKVDEDGEGVRVQARVDWVDWGEETTYSWNASGS